MEKQHLFKSFEMKADEVGGISGFFSTYDKTPDSYGDIIEPGAFTKTLEKRKESGHPFPLCFNHDFVHHLIALYTASVIRKSNRQGCKSVHIG